MWKNVDENTRFSTVLPRKSGKGGVLCAKRCGEKNIAVDAMLANNHSSAHSDGCHRWQKTAAVDDDWERRQKNIYSIERNDSTRRNERIFLLAAAQRKDKRK